MQRFEFAPVSPAMGAVLAIGLAPVGGRYVEVDDTEVRVRLGAAFRGDVPRSSMRSAGPDHGRISGYGAHGWAGRWLVNTTGTGMVRLQIEPRGRGYVLGIPVSLRVLRLSLADPEGFLAAVVG
ncbi:MAG: hypothetical protein ACRDPH_06605 [Marmoricola sp.]